MTRKLDSTPAAPGGRAGAGHSGSPGPPTATVRSAAGAPAAKRRPRPGREALERSPIGDVVDMQDVAAGEDARDGGHQRLVDDRPAGQGRERDAGPLRQLVLGDEADREQQRVAGDLRSVPGIGARPSSTRAHDDETPVAAADLDDGRARARAGCRSPQALADVAFEAARPGQDLEDAFDLEPLEEEAAGHDQADVARAQDDGLVPDPEVVEVDEVLGRARGEDAGRPGPGDADHLPRPFAAAHGQDDGPGPEEPVAVARGDAEEPVGPEVQDHGPRRIPTPLADDVLGQPLGVLGPADRLLVEEEAEAVVDALVEDAARGASRSRSRTSAAPARRAPRAAARPAGPPPMTTTSGVSRPVRPGSCLDPPGGTAGIRRPAW